LPVAGTCLDEALSLNAWSPLYYVEGPQRFSLLGLASLLGYFGYVVLALNFDANLAVTAV